MCMPGAAEKVQELIDDAVAKGAKVRQPLQSALAGPRRGCTPEAGVPVGQPCACCWAGLIPSKARQAGPAAAGCSTALQPSLGGPAHSAMRLTPPRLRPPLRPCRWRRAASCRGAAAAPPASSTLPLSSLVSPLTCASGRRRCLAQSWRVRLFVSLCFAVGACAGAPRAGPTPRSPACRGLLLPCSCTPHTAGAAARRPALLPPAPSRTPSAASALSPPAAPSLPLQAPARAPTGSRAVRCPCSVPRSGQVPQRRRGGGHRQRLPLWPGLQRVQRQPAPRPRHRRAPRGKWRGRPLPWGGVWWRVVVVLGPRGPPSLPSWRAACVCAPGGALCLLVCADPAIWQQPRPSPAPPPASTTPIPSLSLV